MTIAITGASGSLGRATAELVLGRADPSEVVLMTRNPNSLSEFATRGAQVRRADFGDDASLDAAFAGVERLLLISTDAVGARLDHHRAAVAAASRAGVAHVIYTSFPEPVLENPAFVVADHAGTEYALRESGMAWTMLRNNLYAHMQVPGIEHGAASGRMLSNSGAGGTAYVTREDCAAVAAAILVEGGHEGTVYDVTGPAAVTSADLAAFAGAVRGTPVEVTELPDADYVAELHEGGLPKGVSELLASFGASARGGYLAAVSTVVQDVTGRPATALADLLASTPR